MGSIISLGINKMEIDWGKNGIFNNHSVLFQEDDFNQDIPYYYIEYIDDDSAKEIVKYKKGARKKLSAVKERLDLLGFDLSSIEKKYNANIKEYEFYTDEKVNLTFEEFYEVIKSLDISKVNTVLASAEGWENGYDLGEYFKECIMGDEEFSTKIKGKEFHYLIGTFFENLEPYITLRILAENKSNLDYYVEWHYNDVVEEGWIKRDDVVKELPDKDKILIVTEGSTDSFIIKKTIDTLYPNISDFFMFIDMEENYPFTGVGNLKNFCKGLSKINIQNNIIVLFDNDTAGTDSYNTIKNIPKPKNLVFCHLPEHSEFKEFETIGPFGYQKADINGKAVSIECFLDLSSEKAIVRWNNFNEKIREYQGALENKDEYTRKFKKASLLDGSYDCGKLKYLIDYIIKQWLNRG